MTNLTITKAKVYPYKRKSRTGAVGVGMVIFDCGLMLTGLELIEHGEKRFIGYPKNPYNLKGHSYVEPLTFELKKLIRDSLFAIYDSNSNNSIVKEDDSFIKSAVEDMFSTLAQQSEEAKVAAEREKTEKDDAIMKKIVETAGKKATEHLDSQTPVVQANFPN